MTFTIRQARTHAGLTQEDMAKFLNMDRGTYAKIEKNQDRATMQQIKSIAEITGISARDIFLADNSTNVEYTS